MENKKRIFKMILGIIVILFLALTIAIVINTIRFGSKQGDAEFVKGIIVDGNKAAERLSSAIKLKTISHQKAEDFEEGPFLQMIDLLSESFPLVEATLEKKVVNRYSLLYKWNGNNPSLKPIAFLAHLDVVPSESENEWKHSPFSGTIADGFVWGRGALDDKSSVFAALEAVEHLILQEFVPNRTVYLAFGHDEEIGGREGAAKIAEHFERQSISLLFTLDEGLAVVDEKLSPAKKVTGIIGIAEKGYTTLKISARAEGGHSSMPPKTSAVGILAKAITSLEENQMPSSLSGPSEKLFDFIGPEMGIGKRALFANQWLFKGLIISILEGKKSTAAMIRTTTAVTMVEGGVKENVLPQHAGAVVNFRTLPGNTSKDVLEHARRVVANSEVSIEFLGEGLQEEPSKVSATDTSEFMVIGKTVKQIFKGAIFAPGLVLAITDSRHYQHVAENNYRFAPYTLGPEDLSRIHGVNERIGIEDYGLMIKFYALLIMNFDS